MTEINRSYTNILNFKPTTTLHPKCSFFLLNSLNQISCHHRFLTIKQNSVQREGISADAKDVHHKAMQRANIIIDNIQKTSQNDSTNERKEIQTWLQSLTARMETDLVERSTEVRLLLLAATAGENILFIGPPGTGKSELGRRLSSLCRGSYFERLLTKFSVPEELFGPLSMRALEEDQYVRHTKGYLPESKVAFIDEIFKANSAILNSLLTILNERLFDNGNRRYRIPLICLVGASNEVPESEELDALYDRFLFRKMVRQVSTEGFSKLIYTLKSKKNTYCSDINTEELSGHDSINKSLRTAIPDDELYSIRNDAQMLVHIPEEVVLLINDIREFVQAKLEPEMYLSDRRLMNAIKTLKVVAFTNGRNEVSPFDCIILQHCLWKNPGQQEPIFEFLVDKLSADKEITNFEVIIQRIFARSCLVLTGAGKDDSLHDDMETLQNEVISRLKQLNSSLVEGLLTIENNIWISPEEASSLSPIFLHKIRKSKNVLEDILVESEILKEILQGKKEPSICAELLGARWADFLKSPLKLNPSTRA